MSLIRIMQKMPAPPEFEPRRLPPTAADVLSWCAAAGPTGWFPAVHAQTTGTPRDQLYEPTNDLVRLGMIEGFDWVRGRGQGFVLTELGRQKVGTPLIINTVATPPQRPLGLTTIERGDRARKALLEPDPAVVAPVLVVAISFWFLIGFFLSMNQGTSTAYLGFGDSETIIRIGATYGPRMAAGEWWRLATGCFVHIGLIHLLLNGYGLTLAGSMAEGLWGRRKFLVIFILSALAGSALASALIPHAILAGASGGIWGVLLSIVAWLILNRQHFERPIIRSVGKHLGFAVLVNAAASAIPGVAWHAHLAGGVAGFLTAWLLHSVRSGTGWRRWISLGALSLAVATGTAAYRYAVIRGSAWEPIWKFETARRGQLEQKGINALIESVNLQTALIPFSRIQQIHRDGTVAAAAGSQKRLDAVRNEASRLKVDAHAAVAAFEAIPVRGQDLQRIRMGVEYFQNVAAFAAEMETAAKGPPLAKTWTGFAIRLKELKSQFLALTTAPLTKPPTE
jgi:rhomboid protease GluP